MPHRQNTLPDTFKALNKKTGEQYTCKRDSEATYKVSWPYGTEGKRYNVVYAEGTLKEIIFKDKSWSIMEDAKKELPEKFKFYFHNDTKQDTLYTATFCDGLYHIDWEGRKCLSTEGKVFVERHVECGRWKIVEETPEQCLGKQMVSLQDIQEFCKECSAEITFAYIHGEPHYDVFYSDSEVAQAESDEGLLEIMKAIRVLYGSK